MEEGLILVATVTGLPTAILLGAAIVYGCIWCYEKLSKRTKKAEESKKRRKKDQWEENVTNMESCLKENTVRRKERRESARIVERNRTFKAEIERGARLALEDKEFLKKHPQYKALAESKL